MKKYFVKINGEEVELSEDQVRAGVKKGTINASNLIVEDVADTQPAPVAQPPKSLKDQVGDIFSEFSPSNGKLMETARAFPATVYRGAKQALQGILAGVETIPTAISAVDLRKDMPLVTTHPDVDVKGKWASNYADLQSSPNFLESILTDPLTYSPSVGPALAGKVGYKGAKLASKYLVDPLLQTGVETAVNPDIGVGESLTQFGVGSALGAALPYVGNKIKSGAVSTLGKDLKLRPSDQSKKFAPELEVLFKEGDIPWFGGREGIASNVSEKLGQLTADRRAYMTKELDRALKNVNVNRADLESIHGFIRNDVDRSAVDITGMKDKLFADVDANMQLEPPERDELKQMIDEKIGYLAQDNPVANVIDANIDQSVDRILDISNQLTTDQRIGLTKLLDKWSSGDVLSEADIDATGIDMDMINELFGNLAYGGIGESKVKRELIPLILASDRRSGWFAQGKVNKGVPKSEANEAKAANMLWGEMSQRLASNPTYAGYSGRMAKYVPLEQAMAARAGALDNRYSLPIDLTAIPGGVVRNIWQSNPSLITRYGVGGVLPKAKPTVYITPMFTDEQDQ